MANWCDNIHAPTDANGCVVPLDTKELVYKGETLDVYGFFYNIKLEDWFVEFLEYDSVRIGACTMPDSWEKLEEDARKTPSEYIEERGITVERNGRVATMTSDILLRAKTLAGLIDRTNCGAEGRDDD